MSFKFTFRGLKINKKIFPIEGPEELKILQIHVEARRFSKKVRISKKMKKSTLRGLKIYAKIFPKSQAERHEDL